MSRIIGHLDMDAFFAAIEERDTPRFQGLPIVVGADPRGGAGRGVVSTANYRARAYGIHSAMPITIAWRLSQAAVRRGDPAAIFLPGNYHRYEDISRRIMALLRAAVPLVQQRSVDEAYFDLSHTGSVQRAVALCRRLKEEIRQQERLTASVGVGPNKLIAKIASDLQKPDGFTVVEEKDAEAFLAPLPIRKVPGVGPKTEAFFHANGVHLVRDARAYSRSDLETLLGKWGLDLYEKLWGRDTSPVHEAYTAKSVGTQETFNVDTLDSRIIGEHLSTLCARVLRRLEAEGFHRFRTVVLTVRFANFRTVSRASTSTPSLHTLQELHQQALRLLLPFFDARENPRREPLRLIGVRVEKLE
ncbi:MAG: DNA polymerase IV [Parcubacteria group bacterium Gr01-1014_38]|nr:MAG: DNA polymerase IV [Parcubacteria group bacterium Gr01-1014_38]